MHHNLISNPIVLQHLQNIDLCFLSFIPTEPRNVVHSRLVIERRTLKRGMLLDRCKGNMHNRGAKDDERNCADWKNYGKLWDIYGQGEH